MPALRLPGEHAALFPVGSCLDGDGFGVSVLSAQGGADTGLASEVLTWFAIVLNVARVATRAVVQVV